VNPRRILANLLIRVGGSIRRTGWKLITPDEGLRMLADELGIDL
jgi:hypothetical protein